LRQQQRSTNGEGERAMVKDTRSSAEPSVKADEAGETAGQIRDFIVDFHGVRYQVKDVQRSVVFYTRTLGLKLEHQQLPDFATVSLGALKILLSGPGASGSRPMPNGQRQEPGGWNRVVLRVQDLQSCVERMKKAGLHLRNAMEPGPGGKQIQFEDPDGNPIEFFEPAQRSR
jgi:glyoxylase I family protein